MQFILTKVRHKYLLYIGIITFTSAIQFSLSQETDIINVDDEGNLIHNSFSINDELCDTVTRNISCSESKGTNCCTVMSITGNNTVICTGATMKTLPQLSDDTILAILIKYGQLQTIEPYAFKGIKSKYLEIEFGGVVEIKVEAFNGTESLEYLSITKNWLGSMGRFDLIFAGLPHLIELKLDDNNILNWNTSVESPGVIENSVFPNLKRLSLEGNPIESLTNSSFEWLERSSLEYLSLKRCRRIKTIYPDILLPVKQQLKYLELGYSSITSELLKSILSVKLQNMKGLGLSSIGLYKIPTDGLKLVNESLEFLSLYGNNFPCINSCQPERYHYYDLDQENSTEYVFPKLNNLYKLDLRKCGISYIPTITFSQMPKLKVLLLSENNLLSIKSGTFQKLSNLLSLNISHNNLNEGYETTSLSFNFEGLESLEILDLSETKFIVTGMSFNDLGNLKMLFLCNSNLSSIKEAVFNSLKKLEILDLSKNPRLEISKATFTGLGKLKQLHITHSNIDLLNDPFEYLSSLEILNLSSNKIQFLNETKFAFQNKLKKLILNNNGINTWASRIFSNNLLLDDLHIQGNQLLNINEAMLHDLLRLRVVDLSENPFLCFCSLKKFVRTMKNTNIEILFWDHGGSYKCLSNFNNKRQKYSYKFKLNDGCIMPSIYKHEESHSLQSNIKQVSLSPLYVALGSIASILLLMMMCCWKRHRIYHLSQAIRNATILSLMDDNNEECFKQQNNYLYDVFVSYSDPNRQWVLEELIPNLEVSSAIKVCLHERDFQVGTSILENIINSMDQSRWILLVLSKAFLQSHWCQFELHLAQHRLLETRREDLILVLLENIPNDRRPKILRYLMLTKTYIQWPVDNSDDIGKMMFWKRLQQVVLPSCQFKSCVSEA